MKDSPGIWQARHGFLLKFISRRWTPGRKWLGVRPCSSLTMWCSRHEVWIGNSAICTRVIAIPKNDPSKFHPIALATRIRKIFDSIKIQCFPTSEPLWFLCRSRCSWCREPPVFFTNITLVRTCNIYHEIYAIYFQVCLQIINRQQLTIPCDLWDVMSWNRSVIVKNNKRKCF